MAQPMSQEHRDILRSKCKQLAKEIKVEIKEVVRGLFEEKILMETMVERIECKETPTDRAYALLDILPSRGHKALDAFYRVCLSSGLSTAAELLYPGRQANEEENSPENDENGGDAELSSDDEDIFEESTITVRNVTRGEAKHKAMNDLYLKSLSPKQDSIYTMNVPEKGRVLVIDNEIFSHLENRDGSNKDRIALNEAFGSKGFGFDVECLQNLPVKEMKEELEQEAATDFSKWQCFILFILSHGHTGVVYGTDGKIIDGKPQNCLKIQDITDLFCKNQTLRSKPKLFFIQACQGTESDPGVTKPTAATQSLGGKLDSSSGKTNDQSGDKGVDEKSKLGSGIKKTGAEGKTCEDSAKHKDQTDGLEVVGQNQAQPEGSPGTAAVESGDQDEDVVLQYLEDYKKKGEEESDASGDLMPSRGDVFLALATTEGYVSWRNTVFGTWFIQAIVRIFAKYACKLEINHLMLKVNNKVSKKETFKGKKQISKYSGTMSKQFYFFPGLHETEKKK